MTSSPDIPDNLIEIRDPEIDPTAIMAEIRVRVEQRRRELGYDNRRFPTFGTADYPGEPEDIPFDDLLYHHLRLANRHYAEVETRPVLVSSPATRLPLLGRLWGLIRGGAHNLVLFYVNRLAAQQININRHLVSVLNRQAAQAQAQERRLQQLEEELAHLRSAKDKAGE
ncbi:MAG: hypothetical protein KJ063_05255 [Anaerolineae bacterium]|nr:hypothetical protein [Anaerolineae bacterium]